MCLLRPLAPTSSVFDARFEFGPIRTDAESDLRLLKQASFFDIHAKYPYEISSLSRHEEWFVLTDGNIERRLAAVLLTDVVGYSRLMGENETGTLEKLQEHQFALINPTVGQYRGRIVKNMGDGILVEFKSATDAVECAVAIQKGMVSRNSETPENRQIRLRIGVNIGDLLIDGDEIYGGGINVASRLQEMAVPNGVCISNAVMQHIE